MSVKIDLTGKKAIVFGIANDKSIAWHIAKRLDDAGCRIAAAYQERVEPLFMPLMKELDNPIYEKCDVVSDELLDSFFKKVKDEFGNVDFLIHSIAFAKKLSGSSGASVVDCIARNAGRISVTKIIGSHH